MESSIDRNAHDQTWRSPLGRAGLAAKGILYLSLGALAISLALGGRSSESVSQTGAVAELADLPSGRWLVLLVSLGLIALTLWNAVRALTGDPVTGSEASDRFKYGGWAVLYGLTAVASIRVLSSVWNGGSSGGSSSSDGSEKAASVLMDLPGGTVVVVVAGLGLLAFAVHQFTSHAKDAEFMQRIDTADLPERSVDLVEAAGRVGYVAKGIVTAMIGVFFVSAGFTQDPDEAGGLSQALGTLAASGWGRLVLWVVAAGLLCYGLFALVEARYRTAA